MKIKVKVNNNEFIINDRPETIENIINTIALIDQDKNKIKIIMGDTDSTIGAMTIAGELNRKYSFVEYGWIY